MPSAILPTRMLSSERLMNGLIPPNCSASEVPSVRREGQRDQAVVKLNEAIVVAAEQQANRNSSCAQHETWRRCSSRKVTARVRMPYLRPIYQWFTEGF